MAQNTDFELSFDAFWADQGLRVALKVDSSSAFSSNFEGGFSQRGFEQLRMLLRARCIRVISNVDSSKVASSGFERGFELGVFD